ncbi:hypothetical protein JCM10450v2_002938 [Rhodotorula kratochvilovae]
MAARTLLLATALAAAASSVTAHSIVTSVWINGKDTADAGVGSGSSYMRTPSSNSPVKDLTSAALACNDRGTNAVSGYLKVAAGDTIEPEWYHSGGRGDDPIATSHVGPITTWISPLEANTQGDVWVQIASEAYWKDRSQWAVDKLNANKGRHTVHVPADLAPGKYLMRFDIVGLHEAQSAGGAQFYPNCAQVEVTGSGKTALPKGVSIPGFFTASTPGVVWVYYSGTYDTKLDYVAPGTGVWDGSSSYSTATCKEVVYGLAPAGYCQSGATKPVTTTSKAPASTSKAATTSKAVTTSKVATTSVAAPITSSRPATSAVVTTTSKAAVVTTVRPTTSVAATPVTSQAATTTSSASGAAYTDYNSCMRAYNKCLDSHQSKSGGAVDFSECYSSFQCSSLKRERFKRAAHAAPLRRRHRA